MTTTTTTKVQTFNPNKTAASTSEVRHFLEANIGAVRRVAVATMNPARMVAILGAALSRSPLLAKCTPMSLLRCLAQGAELGLEVAGGLQEFHPIPYWNTDLGCYEAQGIPGYPGLTKLVLQTGSVARISAQVVYEGDEFDYALGDKPFLLHKPSLDNLGLVLPDDKIKAFYAVAFFKDGGAQFEVMGKAAVDRLKARSLEKKKNTDHSPWTTDYSEMGRKTALRRLCKALPKTPALARALDLQAQAESGEFTGADILDQVPLAAPDVTGEALPPTDVPKDAPAHPGPQQPAQPKSYVMGGGLSEKQIGAARAAAARLSVDPAGAEAVIAVYSNAAKPEPKQFMDIIFSRDDQKITAAFLTHPSFQDALKADNAPEPPPGDPPPPPPSAKE